MEAANEATAVFGRLLSQLGDRLDGIEEQLLSIATRLDSLERPAGPAPRRTKPASSPTSGRSASSGKSSG
jgi:hypothetical protein